MTNGEQMKILGLRLRDIVSPPSRLRLDARFDPLLVGPPGPESGPMPHPAPNTRTAKPDRSSKQNCSKSTKKHLFSMNPSRSSREPEETARSAKTGSTARSPDVSKENAHTFGRNDSQRSHHPSEDMATGTYTQTGTQAVMSTDASPMVSADSPGPSLHSGMVQNIVDTLHMNRFSVLRRRRALSEVDFNPPQASESVDSDVPQAEAGTMG
ncbi:hypothetical protein DFH11DRAFT_1546979 [Phellopilus nigrolimitatus]|nr:hypothetical protein DFH11DRAFT_1546979 [Phellopilus nigrolimitatus]